MPKKPQKPESEPEEEMFHVGNLHQEYHVKWGGYDSDADSWEPEQNVGGCDRLLRSFWDHVGMDNEDYEIGHEIEAKPAWIKKEREFFAKNFGKDEEERKRKKEQEKKKKRYKGFSVSASNTKSAIDKQAKAIKEVTKFVHEINSGSSAEESDDMPVSSLPARKSASAAKSGDDESVVSIPDSDSDSEETPLSTQPKASSLRVGKKRKAQAISSAPSTSKPKVSLTEPPRKVPRTLSNTFKMKASTSAKGKAPMVASPHPAPSSTPESPTSLFSDAESPDPAARKKLPPASSASVQAKPLVTASKPAAGQIRRRYAAPKIQRIDPPMMTSGSALATKQRLAAGGLMAPKPVNPLSKLSFKKNPTATANQEMGSPQSIQPPAATTAVPARPAPGFRPEASTSRVSDATDINQSPPYDYQDFGGMDVDAPPEPSLPEPPQPAANQPPVPRRMTAAEKFLATIMPTSLSAPIQDGVETSNPVFRPAAAPPVAKIGIAGQPRIPRKFKWIGEIFMNTKKDHAERICNAMLSDLTPGIPNGSRFNYVFNEEHPVDSVRLKGLLHMTDLALIRPACSAVAQMAKLGPEDKKDTDASEALRTLSRYMAPRQLVTYTTLYASQTEISALLLIIPSASDALCAEFKVPSELQKSSLFVAALVPWALPEKQASSLRIWRMPEEREPFAYLTDNAEPVVVADLARSVRSEPRYHRALHVLRFPKWLHSFMSQPGRKYCLWKMRGDGTPEELETQALKCILGRCAGAEDAGHKADVRVVFVHVGSLDSLHKLPALAERRKKRPEIQFFTYGTHERVPPERWGIHEIYPLGGIVTFTPSVFREHPLAVYKVISMLEEHPLWDCYIVPSVVAMVARETSGTEPLTALEKGDFVHAILLDMIEEGRLSLMSTVPVGRARGAMISDWISWQTQLPCLTARGILEKCMRSFIQQYDDTPEEQWPSAVESEVVTSISSLQLQPAIMDNYRRFVVIRGEQDGANTPRDSIEWIPISQFDFRDDFFPDFNLSHCRR
ncbi:hypothetical protein EW146_g3874 [Bondarzewia mesenterica]|uniref:Chromo domain-containing protein n=1 Tax=Bondarzewia mesenterica TaxID=1095465 RepID=A0A4S4LXH9_9AGAM|nr:hypothetical protein EW146_g3874 [Bondarzewia mesenterica]